MLTIIVAMDAKGGIGIDNHLPWYLPEELAHFKKVTLGHPIIMGRKTYESIGRPLPGRRNIVLTRQANWRRGNVEVAGSLLQALELTQSQESFVIGGSEVFTEALPLADRLILTRIGQVFPCDAFFPKVDFANWEEVTTEPYYSKAAETAFSVTSFVKRPIQPGPNGTFV